MMPWSKERRKEVEAIRPAGTNRLCCVPLCDYNTLAYWRRPGAELRSMHKFPYDPTRKQKWIENIQRRQPDGTPWEPVEASRVCSAHFSDICFLDRFIARGSKYRDRARVNKHLANFAIPTIFPGYPQDIVIPHQIPRGAKHFVPESKSRLPRKPLALRPEDDEMLNTPIGSFETMLIEMVDKLGLAPHWHLYRTGAGGLQQHLLNSDGSRRKLNAIEQQLQDRLDQQENTVTLTCLNYANVDQPHVVGWIIINENLDTAVRVPGSIVLEARLQYIIMSGNRRAAANNASNAVNTVDNLIRGGDGQVVINPENAENGEPAAEPVPPAAVPQPPEQQQHQQQEEFEEGSESRLVTWNTLACLVSEIEQSITADATEPPESNLLSSYATAGEIYRNEYDEKDDIKPVVAVGSLVDVPGANGQHVSGRIISVSSSRDDAHRGGGVGRLSEAPSAFDRNSIMQNIRHNDRNYYDDRMGAPIITQRYAAEEDDDDETSEFEEEEPEEDTEMHAPQAENLLHGITPLNVRFKREEETEREEEEQEDEAEEEEEYGPNVDDDDDDDEYTANIGGGNRRRRGQKQRTPQKMQRRRTASPSPRGVFSNKKSTTTTKASSAGKAVNSSATRAAMSTRRSQQQPKYPLSTAPHGPDAATSAAPFRLFGGRRPVVVPKLEPVEQQHSAGVFNGYGSSGRFGGRFAVPAAAKNVVYKSPHVNLVMGAGDAEAFDDEGQDN